jgi:hypothetical protein
MVTPMLLQQNVLLCHGSNGLIASVEIHCCHPHALLMGSLLILVMNSVALGKVLACRRFVRAIREVLMGMFVSLDHMHYR